MKKARRLLPVVALAIATLMPGAGTATADATAGSGAPVEASAPSAAAACPVPGQRVKTSSSARIFVIDPDRYLYWIPNETVYNNVFRTWGGIATFDNLFVGALEQMVLVTASVGQTIQFTDTSENTPTEWLWNFGDSTTSTLQNPTKAYSAPGTYTVTLTVSNGAGSDSETKTGYISVS